MFLHLWYKSTPVQLEAVSKISGREYGLTPPAAGLGLLKKAIMSHFISFTGQRANWQRAKPMGACPPMPQAKLSLVKKNVKLWPAGNVHI
jgi:hypothetical protein